MLLLQNIWHPLYVAVQNGHLEVVRRLVGAPRVDVNTTTKVNTSCAVGIEDLCGQALELRSVQGGTLHDTLCVVSGSARAFRDSLRIWGF